MSHPKPWLPAVFDLAAWVLVAVLTARDALHGNEAWTLVGVGLLALRVGYILLLIETKLDPPTPETEPPA